MITNIYSILDKKSKTFGRLIPCKTPGAMLREFTDIANDKTHPIGLHPEDYVLYHVADHDDQNGTFENIPHKSYGMALGFVKAEIPNPIDLNKPKGK